MFVSRRSIQLLALVTGVLSSAIGAQSSTKPKPIFSIHGYLTQAYGFSHGGMVTGLTNEGTADYGRAAILATYAVSPANRFVMQVAHRRLGDSPTMQFEDNVKLDMAFYEHQFRDGTRVRFGKTVMPFGIYNEIRYAGTLQPFYRAPLSLYWEGTYTSETIDGAMVSRQVRTGKAWELTADLFGGSNTFLEFGTIQTAPTAPPSYVGAKIQAKNVLGTQLWLTTPLEGLRVGLSGRRHTDFGGIYNRVVGVPAKEWTASVDGNFEKWLTRAEMAERRAQGVVVASKYAQLGFRPIELFSVNAQSEFMDYRLPPGLGLPSATTVKVVRDNAASVNLFLNSTTVFKLEAHTTKGLNVEQVVNLLGAVKRGSYFISSFSVSF